MIRSLVIFDIPFALFFSLSTFAQADRESEPFGKISNATYEISINKLTPKDENGIRTVSFSISNLKTRESDEIEYKTNIRDFYKLLITPNEKLLVIGEEMWSHGQYVDIIDLKKKKEENSFLCYDYWMSPSGRYMAFTTWHPRMDMIRQYLLAVHDFYEDSLATPLAIKDKPNPEHASGWVIFPEENVRNQSGNVTLTKGFTIQSPVQWEKNETLIFFFIFDEDRQKNHLIMADLKAGLNNPAIFRKYIDINKLLHWNQMRNEYKVRYEKETFRFYADSLELTDKFTIKTKSHYDFYDKENEFSLDDLECTLEGSK